MKRFGPPVFEIQKKQRTDIVMDEALPYLPSDTEVAIEVLKQRYPKGLPFVALKSQVFHLVHDNTIAERELEKLREAGTFRVFKLLSSDDDFLIVPNEQFTDAIHNAFKPFPELQSAMLPLFLEFAKRNNALMLNRADVMKQLKAKPVVEEFIR